MPLGRFLKVLLGGLLALAILFVAAAEISGTLLPVKPSDYLGGYAAIQQAAWQALNTAQACAMRVLEWFRDLSAEEWIALSTGILAIATIMLWIVTQSIFIHGRRTTEQQLRGYVLVESAVIAKDPMREDGFGVSVTIKNFGKTPVHDMTNWAKVHVDEFPLTKKLPEHDSAHPSKTVLAPNAQSLQIPTHSELTELMQRAIFDRSTAVYVYGKIEYIDVFGENRTTNFRLMCVGQGLALGLFRPCQEGNDYT